MQNSNVRNSVIHSLLICSVSVLISSEAAAAGSGFLVLASSSAPGRVSRTRFDFLKAASKGLMMPAVPTSLPWFSLVLMSSVCRLLGQRLDGGIVPFYETVARTTCVLKQFCRKLVRTATAFGADLRANFTSDFHRIAVRRSLACLQHPCSHAKVGRFQKPGAKYGIDEGSHPHLRSCIRHGNTDNRQCSHTSWKRNKSICTYIDSLLGCQTDAVLLHDRKSISQLHLAEDPESRHYEGRARVAPWQNLWHLFRKRVACQIVRKNNPAASQLMDTVLESHWFPAERMSYNKQQDKLSDSTYCDCQDSDLHFLADCQMLLHFHPLATCIKTYQASALGKAQQINQRSCDPLDAQTIRTTDAPSPYQAPKMQQRASSGAL
jgi:hypothetical protein